MVRRDMRSSRVGANVVASSSEMRRAVVKRRRRWRGENMWTSTVIKSSASWSCMMPRHEKVKYNGSSVSPAVSRGRSCVR